MQAGLCGLWCCPKCNHARTLDEGCADDQGGVCDHCWLDPEQTESMVDVFINEAITSYPEPLSTAEQQAWVVRLLIVILSS